ncbi:cAMP-binding protein [Desulfitobacterium dichloroeliminans LMG P-21439]|uniref:cAMP-binding protein n=1 Tax=Desulfitobacterium dichloroeliminans (strain LMG P-21439 / DCA1) TaxID=871963 RepID=L0FAB8_DESDL|nr:Crp/Fnr family transcriptional regulator [Desulfitobacterium dichloroeliminans]AGA69586.1 cAMP-binding protein [Desulfitobacterium dichloroeliminans LMG P-21439]
MLDPKTLRRFSLFTALPDEDLAPILPLFKTRKYRKGQVLFIEGEIGSEVYFILEGQVKLSKTLPNGDEQILDWCGPSDSLADILLVEPGSYPATAEALKDSTLLVLPNQGVVGILESHPHLAVALIRKLNMRLRMNQEFIRVLTSRSTAGILAMLLLRLAKPATALGQPIYYDATLTNKDLASMIGTSRELVNRTLNQWKKSDIIRQNEDRIEILRPHELADWP